MMENTATKTVLTAVVALVLGGIGGYIFAGGESANPSATNAKELALYQEMRKLWADHVFWTREYIIAAVDGTADLQQATDRLMKNQEDIGAAIVPYYGQEAGDKLTSLLKEHILIAMDLVAAAKRSDTAKFDQANARWDKNADDIAAFLANANRNWPEEILAEAMSMHLKTTIDEATARLTKDYAADVRAFDAVFDHIMEMSDTLSVGIIKQFPDKF